jgi:hypothetical protein
LIANLRRIWKEADQRRIKQLAGIVILVGLLGFLAYNIYKNWQEIRKYPWQFDYRYLLAGFVLYTINLFATGAIWGTIITRLSGIKGYLLHIRWYCLTNLAQRLPTPIPFVGARAEVYSSLGVPRSLTLTGMSLEITITMVGALLVSIITLPFAVGEFTQLLGTYWMWLFLIPILLIIIKPKWLFKITGWIFMKFHRTFSPPEIRSVDMLIWTGLFAVIWIVGGILYYLLANSIYPVPFNEVLGMINVFAISGVVGWLGQLLFFIPLVTVRQIAVAYLLSSFMPWPVAVGVALLTRLAVMIYEFMWAVFFFLTNRKTISSIINNK